MSLRFSTCSWPHFGHLPATSAAPAGDDDLSGIVGPQPGQSLFRFHCRLESFLTVGRGRDADRDFAGLPKGHELSAGGEMGANPGHCGSSVIRGCLWWRPFWTLFVASRRVRPIGRLGADACSVLWRWCDSDSASSVYICKAYLVVFGRHKRDARTIGRPRGVSCVLYGCLRLPNIACQVKNVNARVALWRKSKLASVR
jgi:hypothetical protein